jgi:hypothetical protein
VHNTLKVGDLVRIKKDLVRIRKAPDQNRYRTIRFWDKFGIVMTQVKDDVTSSPNIWKVFIEGEIVYFHKPDLELISRA